MRLSILAVNYYLFFLVFSYIVDGNVTVTFFQSKVYTFILLGMNCKTDSLGGAKIPYFVHK